MWISEGNIGHQHMHELKKLLLSAQVRPSPQWLRGIPRAGPEVLALLVTMRQPLEPKGKWIIRCETHMWTHRGTSLFHLRVTTFFTEFFHSCEHKQRVGYGHTNAADATGSWSPLFGSGSQTHFSHFHIFTFFWRQGLKRDGKKSPP